MLQVCASTHTNRPRQGGVTLPELLLVVSILVILGSAVLPQVQATRFNRIDLAADAVANAIRFARDEAVRTGLRHMVEVDASAHQVRVAQLPSSGPLPLPLPLARHPMSKQPYEVDVDDDPALGSVTISSLSLQYQGSGSQTTIDFEAAGVPHYQSLSTQQRMLSGSIVLTLGGVTRTITVAPVTGSVAVTGAP